MTPALANALAFLVISFTIPGAFLGLVALHEHMRKLDAANSRANAALAERLRRRRNGGGSK
jgi:hypothetical protein